jgi:hypothetical protein
MIKKKYHEWSAIISNVSRVVHKIKKLRTPALPVGFSIETVNFLERSNFEKKTGQNFPENPKKFLGKRNFSW